MSAAFQLKLNDTRPHLFFTLLEEDGDPIDLTGSTVTFKMRKPGAESYKVDRVAVVASASAGEGHYEWQAGETNELGRFHGEFIVVNGSNQQTIPNANHVVIIVNAHV